MVKREFVNYIHSFRGLAILFVIASHLLLRWDKDSITHTFFQALTENGTLLFVFIAGYLFQHLSGKFDYKDYLIKKINNVIVPYFIVSVPIIVYRLLLNDFPGYILADRPDFLSLGILEKIFYFLTHGAHLQPLWFVPMISLFYFFAPLFIYIDRKPGLYWLLIPLTVLSLYLDRDPFTDIVRMFFHFISVYVFGMFMSRYRREFLKISEKYGVIFVLLFLVLLFLNILYFEKNGFPLNYLQKAVLCCASIFLLWRFEKRIPMFLGKLAEVSFGLFFIHYYTILVLKALYEFIFQKPLHGNVGSWTIYYLLVVVISYFFLVLLKKAVGKRSRWLVGC